MALQLSDLAGLFSASLETFRTALSEEARKEFRDYATAEAMLGELQRVCVKHKERSRLLGCCQRIKCFSDALGPFFDIVGIFVSIKPEWLAGLWGSIRLVFQLGNNYVVFLENVVGMFERIADTLPLYRDHFTTCMERKVGIDQSRLVSVMALMYSDILDFCQQVCCMMSRGRKGSSLRSRIGFVTDVAWKPFNSRFDGLITRMQWHRNLFYEEMKSQDQKVLTKLFEAFQDYLHKSNGNRSTGQRTQPNAEEQIAIPIAAVQVFGIKAWIGPTEYRSIYESAGRSKLHGSGAWFLSKPEYCTWRSSILRADQCENVDLMRETWQQRMLSIQG